MPSINDNSIGFLLEYFSYLIVQGIRADGTNADIYYFYLFIGHAILQYVFDHTRIGAIEAIGISRC